MTNNNKTVQAPRVFRTRLEPNQARQLRRHAERRGLDPDAMFNLLIKTIFDDNLIDAVVDDSGEREPKAAGAGASL